MASRKTDKWDVIRLGYELQARGYVVWEHPSFGGVNPKWHIPNSKHNRGLAIDVNYKPEVPSCREEDDRLDELAAELEARGFGVIWNRGPGDHTSHLHAETLGNPEQYPGRVKFKRDDNWPHIAEDGIWGPATTKALQLALQTPATGEITEDGSSTVIVALQRYLNTEARKSFLTPDGRLGPLTIAALQAYLGTPETGRITQDGPSTVVRALQAQLNKTGALA